MSVQPCGHPFQAADEPLPAVARALALTVAPEVMTSSIRTFARPSTLASIRPLSKKAGVEFINVDQPGVRLRKPG